MINWARVEQLKTEIGASDFDEIVVLFLEEVDEVVAKLEDDLDLSVLGENLHFLKGSALNLGFSRFAALCREGEVLAKTQEADAALVTRIIASYRESRTVFLQRINEPITRVG